VATGEDLLRMAAAERGEDAGADRALAALAAHGFPGPFLTTNFGRPLEQALAEAGLTPRAAYDLAGLAAVGDPGNRRW
jgi:hypothetical protein